MKFGFKFLSIVVVSLYFFTSSYPGSFTTSLSHAEQQVSCKSANSTTKVISWTGGCVNGLLDGDGELVTEMTANGGEIYRMKAVGKFLGGGRSGVSYWKTLDIGGGYYWSMLSVDSSEGSFASYTTSSHPYDDFNVKWYSDKNYKGEISVDEVLEKSFAFAKNNSLASIDLYTLKEYIYGRYKYTQTASNSSIELENHSDGIDDPQVFGGSSSPKAKKSKK